VVVATLGCAFGRPQHHGHGHRPHGGGFGGAPVGGFGGAPGGFPLGGGGFTGPQSGKKIISITISDNQLYALLLHLNY